MLCQVSENVFNLALEIIAPLEYPYYPAEPCQHGLGKRFGIPQQVGRVLREIPPEYSERC